MAQIIERGGERRLQLGGDEFIRGMAWGSAWNKIRIGLRMGFNGVSNFGDYVGGQGICQGAQGYSSPSCISYAGELMNVAYTYTPAAGPYFVASNGNHQTVFRNGTTVLANTASGSIVSNVAWAPMNLSQFFVDIYRFGSLYHFDYRVPVAADVVRTIPVYTFQRNMENENGTMLFCSSATNAVSTMERLLTGQHNFDSVSILHTKTVPTLEIGSLEVIRFE